MKDLGFKTALWLCIDQDLSVPAEDRVAAFLPAYAGFLMEAELNAFVLADGYGFGDRWSLSEHEAWASA